MVVLASTATIAVDSAPAVAAGVHATDAAAWRREALTRSGMARTPVGQDTRRRGARRATRQPRPPIRGEQSQPSDGRRTGPAHRPRRSTPDRPDTPHATARD